MIGENLHLLARAGDNLIAIESAGIGSVVRLTERVPVPCADPAVAGLMAVRSRVLTLVDVRRRVLGEAGGPDRAMLAVIAEVAQHSYGFMVDAVEEVVPIQPGDRIAANGIAPAWQPFATGLAATPLGLAVVLDLAMLVTGPLRRAA